MNYLDPDISYISVSMDAGNRARELGITQGGFDDFRKLIIAVSKQAEEVDGYKNLNTLFRAYIENKQKYVYLLCVVNEGSPAGNKKFTTIIRKILSEAEFQKIYEVQKGFTPLRLPIKDKISDSDMVFIENWIQRAREKFRKTKNREEQLLYSTQYRILETLFNAIKFGD